MSRLRVLLVVSLITSTSVCGCDSPKKEARPIRLTKEDVDHLQAAAAAGVAPKIDAAKAFQYVKEIVAFGRRAAGSPGMEMQRAYLRAKFKDDALEEDVFTADTPAGKFEMRNLIVKIAGTEDSIVVLGSHYDTNYPLKNFVGANDGGSSTALLLAIADQLRGRKLQGPSVWLVFFDGEEAVAHWTATDSVYGSRHLAAKWQADGTAKKIKALILADMIGDADLNIVKDLSSTAWLSDMVLQAATNLGVQSHFYGRSTNIDDDHMPFARIKVPVVDLIDLEYGYNNVFWHTPEDTLDKLSPKSFQIVGDTMLETMRLLGVRY